MNEGTGFALTTAAIFGLLFTLTFNVLTGLMVAVLLASCVSAAYEMGYTTGGVEKSRDIHRALERKREIEKLEREADA